MKVKLMSPQDLDTAGEYIPLLAGSSTTVNIRTVCAMVLVIINCKLVLYIVANLRMETSFLEASSSQMATNTKVQSLNYVCATYRA